MLADNHHWDISSCCSEGFCEIVSAWLSVVSGNLLLLTLMSVVPALGPWVGGLWLVLAATVSRLWLGLEFVWTTPYHTVQLTTRAYDTVITELTEQRSATGAATRNNECSVSSKRLRQVTSNVR